jgi:hypothetical protein
MQLVQLPACPVSCRLRAMASFLVLLRSTFPFLALDADPAAIQLKIVNPHMCRCAYNYLHHEACRCCLS